jgi:hypothetical protein
MAEPEPMAAPVRSDAFKTRISLSPLAVPSCFASTARTSHSSAFSPATLAIRATSPGGHGFAPDFHIATFGGAASISFASAASLPATFEARSISSFRSFMALSFW